MAVSAPAFAASKSDLESSSKRVLDKLIAQVPSAKALDSLDSMQGFEIGVGPSFVVVDSGMAKNITSGTLTQDIYAFVFAQKGLMAGIGLQGNKITRIDK